MIAVVDPRPAILARVDLDQGNGSAGNVNLVPPQSWELNFEAKKELGAWGTTTLKIYGKRYQDYIEWIPLPGGVESRGNIDKATLYGVNSVSTLKLDPLGWKGARINATGRIEDSNLSDPLTATIENLATGSACTVTEPDDAGASTTSIDPETPVTIGTGADPVTVTVTNSFDPGRLLLTKNVIGDAAAYAAGYGAAVLATAGLILHLREWP